MVDKTSQIQWGACFFAKKARPQISTNGPTDREITPRQFYCSMAELL
jgi:hypothetical protein